MDESVAFRNLYVDKAMVERATDVLRSGRRVVGPMVERFEAANLPPISRVGARTVELLERVEAAADTGQRPKASTRAHRAERANTN